MTLILALISFALLILSITLLSNLFLFPRLRTGMSLQRQPLVSVLIPARNEAKVIESTVRSILAQSYQNLELLILDDQSEDGTGELARAAGNGDERLRVLPGKALPDGWIGKSWACHTLSQAAKGEILVFSDADVVWHPEALQAALSYMENTRVDLLTVWPTQRTETWPERLTVPLMALVIMSYLPVLMVHYSRFAIFAAANGQCMIWRRDAYDQIGGHRVVANNVLDDVTLARAAKRKGKRILMVDGNRLIECRMYSDWNAVLHGYAKNILAGYGNSIILLMLATVFHWAIFVLPWITLLSQELQLWSLVLIANGLLIRAVSARFTHQRARDALLMPVSVILMTRIALQALYWHYSGGPRWKGRTLVTSSRGKGWI